MGSAGSVFVQQIGVGIEDSSSNTIGGASTAAANVLTGNEQAGVYILGRASVPQNNLIEGNDIGSLPGVRKGPGNRLYGVLRYNAPANTVVQSGPATNVFAGNGIANNREFTGPLVPAASSSSVQETARRR